MTCSDTGAGEPRAVPTERADVRYSDDSMELAYVLPPLALHLPEDGGEDAGGVAGGWVWRSREDLAGAMRAQTGKHVYLCDLGFSD